MPFRGSIGKLLITLGISLDSLQHELCVTSQSCPVAVRSKLHHQQVIHHTFLTNSAGQCRRTRAAALCNLNIVDYGLGVEDAFELQFMLAEVEHDPIAIE